MKKRKYEDRVTVHNTVVSDNPGRLIELAAIPPPTVDMDGTEIDPGSVLTLPREFCEKHCCVAISRSTPLSIVIAFAERPSLHTIDDIKFHFGLSVDPVLASKESIEQAIEKHYGPKAFSPSEEGSRKG